ncbi:MAG: transaldolase family protein [Chloroflexota bacterium]|jgi:transaldolase
MMIQSVIERLVEANPNLEIWWDSSPLTYDSWKRGMLEHATPTGRPILEEQLTRLLNLDDPAASLVRGCTTNPPLAYEAVKSDPDFWNEWIADAILNHPDLDEKEIAWLTYEETIRLGARIMLPIWQATNGRYGWISGQLDPRLFKEIDVMVSAAEELSSLSSNVMIKVPASTEGITVLRILASKGIGTNTTTCFTLPQILASARATLEGVQLKQKGSFYDSEVVDLNRWRAVITMMVGRLTENPALDEQARRAGITLSWEDKHWFGIAVFQRAYRILKEEGYPSKLLACSLRQGPFVAGRQRFWDVEFLAGDVVYTCPPYVLEPLFEACNDLTFESEAIEKVQVPPRVMDKLLQIPYAIQAYDPNGMWLEQFNPHPATVATIKSFSKAIDSLEAYVGHQYARVRHSSVTA